MEQQRDLLSNDLFVSEAAQATLLASTKWGKFLSIVGFVFCALMVVAGIYIQTIASSLSAYTYGNEFTKYIGWIYIILAGIFFIPCLYLLKFSNKMQEAIRTSNQESFDIALINLKAMFKFYGIVTIVILSIYALIFIIGIGSIMR